MSSSGAVTLGPSGGTAAHTINGNGNSIVTTSGHNLILKKSSGAALMWQDDASVSGTANCSIDNSAGLMRFYNHGGTVNGSLSQAGEWRLGPSVMYAGIGTQNDPSVGFGIVDSVVNVTGYSGFTGSNTGRQGGVFRMDTRDDSSQPLFSWYARAPGVALGTLTMIGRATNSGAWTLGPSSFSGVHNINGAVRVVIPGATTGGFRLSGASSESHLQFLGTNPSTNGSLRFYSYRSDLSNELDVGSISGSGAWTLGPVASNQHIINGGTTPIKLVPNAGTTSGVAFSNSSGTVNAIWESGSGTSALFRIVDSTRTTNYGQCDLGGAWTLGPSGSTTVHEINCSRLYMPQITTSSSTTYATFSVNDFYKYSSSSMRYKNNIQSYGNGLEKVLAMRPVTFTYKPEHCQDDWLQFGFIAEEIEQIEPLLIDYDRSGDSPIVENVKYSHVSAILVKAIQEQQAIIDGLKARIEALENP
jgi:hypothetical protein